jgi:hypothetical protein
VPTWGYAATRDWTGRVRGWWWPRGRRVWRRRRRRCIRTPGTWRVWRRPARTAGRWASSAARRSPRQLPIIERAYLPTERELEEAETIVKAATAQPGALALPDGRFVDAAVVATAQRTLSLARRPALS